MINSNQIALQVFEAIEGDKFLPINKRLSLEYLSSDYDGIFETQKAWKAFVNGNFISDYSKGCWWGGVKESTIKKYCYPVDEYKHLFVVKVGQDKYINVLPDDINLDFSYELYYNGRYSFPSAVELFVTATIKG